MPGTVTVAAIQAAPVSFDLPKSLHKVKDLTAQAAAAGADLVVFPYVYTLFKPLHETNCSVLCHTIGKHSSPLILGGTLLMRQSARESLEVCGA